MVSRYLHTIFSSLFYLFLTDIPQRVELQKCYVASIGMIARGAEAGQAKIDRQHVGMQQGTGERSARHIKASEAGKADAGIKPKWRPANLAECI